MTQAQPPIAHLGLNHGYCFNGDLVELNAEIACRQDALCGQSWSLRLLANDTDPIAELQLGQLFPDANGKVFICGQTAALLPAGSASHTLSLVLCCDGAEIERARYAAPASFALPRLSGECTVTLQDESATLRIEEIGNPRAEDNLSGTLALEIWALDAPYQGNQWTGTPLASVVAGQLGGQQRWQQVDYVLHAVAAPAGSFPTLMLREWTAAGYVTRDFRQLAPSAAAAPVVAEKKVTVTAPEVKTEAKTEVKPETKAAKTKKPAKSTVSVNTASATEISAIKGISDALAKAIVAARPFTSLDELTRVKGMGAKLLAKLRASFSL